MNDRSDNRDDVLEIRGCVFPKRFHYDVENHMWYEPLEGGLVRVGMTVVGPALADYRIFAFTPKRVGRALEAQKSCATIESSKWVGPARIAFDGIVEAVNDDLIDNPGRLATDPYGAAWMLVARPNNADALAGLLTGDAMAAAYTRWLDENDFAGCFPVPE
ncbi:MAG: glycine cleavage system protein H [Hyphomicrobiaceae bacterium]